MVDALNRATDLAKYEIYGILVLSTAHITEHDASLIAAEVFPGKGGDEGSLLVFCSDEADSAEFARSQGYSPAFLAALQLARRLVCRYVLFDRDGPTVDELTLHDW